jgi:hypothetical protein
MKKLLSIFILSLMISGLSKAAVVYDPATVDTAGYGAKGITVVTIDGAKYLQVVLNGWNSTIKIPKFTLGADKGIRSKIKYTKGAVDTYKLASVHAGFNIMDTVNQVPNPWGAGNVPSATAIAQFPATGTWSAMSANYDSNMKEINQLQFFGQHDGGDWGPTTGDTIFVGVISTADASVLFDPATFTGTLPAGMSIVSVGGTSYLKATLTGWDNAFNIDAFATGDNNSFTFKAYGAKGTYTGNEANTRFTVQPMLDADHSFNGTLLYTTTATEVTADAKAGITVSKIQLFNQVTSGDWHADSGLIIYLGKITVKQKPLVIAKPPKTYSAYKVPSADYIQPDGNVDADEFWGKISSDSINRQALPQYWVSGQPKVTDSYGTFKLAWDNDYLYFLLTATDVNPVPVTSSTTWWNDDGCELFIDVIDRHVVGQAANTTNRNQVRFNLGRTDADTTSIGFSSKYISTFNEKAVWVMKQVSPGWQFEVQIPWPNVCSHMVADSAISKYLTDSIIVGKKIAFEVSILNADTKDHRASIMNWANNSKADTAYVTNEFYGEVTLAAEPPAAGVKGNFDNNSKIFVYPNPVADKLYITNAGNVEVTIYDIAGRNMFKIIIRNTCLYQN